MRVAIGMLMGWLWIGCAGSDGSTPDGKAESEGEGEEGEGESEGESEAESESESEGESESEAESEAESESESEGESESESEEEPGIGAGGGSVEVPGARLDVPAGALDEAVAITITNLGDTPPDVETSVMYSSLYRFEPAELVFNVPVTVTFTITDTAEDPAVFWSNPSPSVYFSRLFTTRVGDTVSASITHFSEGYVAPGTGRVCADECCEDSACLLDENTCVVRTGECEGGQCVVTDVLEDGADCDDDDSCTVGDHCQDGECVASPMVCEPRPSTCWGSFVRSYEIPDGVCVWYTGDCEYGEYVDAACASGSCSDGACRGWVLPLATEGAPTPSSNHTVVWADDIDRMIIWGGSAGNGGKIGELAGDDWEPLATLNAPSMRYRHSAVWTGTEMIVWGGHELSPEVTVQTGARYVAAEDRWEATSLVGAPEARESHNAVWTGTEMIVWGGHDSSGDPLSDGASYDPDTDTWTPLTGTAPIGPTTGHTVVWAAEINQMLIWGGEGANGASYEPGVGWATIVDDPVESQWRSDHAAVWTGTEMIVWGGYPGGDGGPAGGSYNPVTEEWSSMSEVDAPVLFYGERTGHTAIWTGLEMMVWGSSISAAEEIPYGAIYNPTTDDWRELLNTNQPTLRSDHTAVWTGSAMIIWGGGGYDPQTFLWTDFNSGAVFVP